MLRRTSTAWCLAAPRHLSSHTSLFAVSRGIRTKQPKKKEPDFTTLDYAPPNPFEAVKTTSRWPPLNASTYPLQSFFGGPAFLPIIGALDMQIQYKTRSYMDSRGRGIERKSYWDGTVERQAQEGGEYMITRVPRLAEHLVELLDEVYPMHEDRVQELCQSPNGDTLLRLVGRIYIEEAKRYRPSGLFQTIEEKRKRIFQSFDFLSVSWTQMRLASAFRAVRTSENNSKLTNIMEHASGLGSQLLLKMAEQELRPRLSTVISQVLFSDANRIQSRTEALERLGQAYLTAPEMPDTYLSQDPQLYEFIERVALDTLPEPRHRQKPTFQSKSKVQR